MPSQAGPGEVGHLPRLQPWILTFLFEGDKRGGLALVWAPSQLEAAEILSERIEHERAGRNVRIAASQAYYPADGLPELQALWIDPRACS